MTLIRGRDPRPASAPAQPTAVRRRGCRGRCSCCLPARRRLRPGYDPVRHPVSSLALGACGWVQIANFLVAGVLTFVFAVGLRRSLRPGPGALMGPVLVGMWGIACSVPGSSSPTRSAATRPGPRPCRSSPAGPACSTTLFSLPGFAAFTRRCSCSPTRSRRRRAPGLVCLLRTQWHRLRCPVRAGQRRVQPGRRWVGTAGLWQRLAVGLGWLWLALFAARQIRHQRRPG